MGKGGQQANNWDFLVIWVVWTNVLAVGVLGSGHRTVLHKIWGSNKNGSDLGFILTVPKTLQEEMGSGASREFSLRAGKSGKDKFWIGWMEIMGNIFLKDIVQQGNTEDVNEEDISSNSDHVFLG